MGEGEGIGRAKISRISARDWGIAIALALVAAVVAGLISAAREPVFRASARILVSPSDEEIPDDRVLYRALYGLQNREILETLVAALEARASETGFGGESREGTVQASAVSLPKAYVVELKVLASEPQVASREAARLLREGIDFMRQRYPVWRFEALGAMDSPAVPESPRPRRDSGLVGLLGLLVGSWWVMARSSGSYGSR